MACDLLDEHVCAARLCCRRLEGEQVVVEPKRFTFAGIERDGRASMARLYWHGNLLLGMVMRLASHNEHVNLI
jgi:hypothetical protein